MSGDLSAVENSVEEILIDLMVEKVMFIGVQASSTRGLQESPSTAHRSGPSRTAIEKRSKHRDDLANTKLISSVLPNYIPPLAGTISYDSIPRDFEYTLIIVYLPKGIHAVRANQYKISTLKFNEFNLGDRKIYSMLAP
jgi:hypothetical protein